MNDHGVVQQASISSNVEKSGAGGPVSAPAKRAAQTKSRAALARRIGIALAVLVVLGVAGYFGWKWLQPAKLPAGFASSNGRIEATEIDIATKLAGRILDELVDEGNLVTAGQVVAHMDIESLQAERREAVAKLAMAKSTVEAALATLAQRQAEKVADEAIVKQREADLDLATRKFNRAQQLIQKSAISQDQFDTDKDAFYSATAGLSSAKAAVAAADAAIATAKAMKALGMCGELDQK